MVLKIYGYTTKFGSGMNTNDKLYGIGVTVEQECNLKYVKVYLKQYGGQHPTCICCLYGGDSVVCSETWVMTDGFDGWKTFIFPTYPKLNIGILYKIMFHVFGGYPTLEATFYFENDVDKSYYTAGSAYESCPDVTISLWNPKISFYAVVEYFPSILPINPYLLKIGVFESDYIKLHYIKNHPSPDPDTFEVTLMPDMGEKINYFDMVEIQKNGVTEFVGFVENINISKGASGLEYLLTGRCWKLMPWKKQTERFMESREVGVYDSAFFGRIYPEELIKFLFRCPISIHPSGYIRQKIGWGIPADAWECTASSTATGHHPQWVALREIGFSWLRGGVTGYQAKDDWFKIDLGAEYDRVTAILIENRQDVTESRFARHFSIYVSQDDITYHFVYSKQFNNARDILASWKPEDNVRYIKIVITANYDVGWEISQIYVWQTNELKYRLLNET